MNRQQKAYAKKIDLLRRYINDHQQVLRRLIRKCNHLIVKFGWSESAVCSICGKRFGWYCEKSPTKCCHYNYSSLEESCNYCGQPSERK